MERQRSIAGDRGPMHPSRSSGAHDIQPEHDEWERQAQGLPVLGELEL